MKINVTYDGAKKMTKIFTAVSNKELVKVEDINNVLETTEAYRIWLNALEPLIPKQEYLNIWCSIINGNEYKGKLESIYKRFKLILQDTSSLVINLNYVQKIDYSNIEKLVSLYLPEDTDMELNLHFIVDGFNGGTIIGMNNYTQCITMLYPNYFYSFGIYGMAHEFHHIGSRYWRGKDKKRMELINKNDSISLAIKLVSSILDEGSAVYFFDNQVDKEVMKIIGSKIIGKEQYEKIISVHSQEKLKVADRIVELDLFLRQLFEEVGELDTLRKKVHTYTFMQGIKPSLDKLIGQEMVRTIDRVFGKEKVLQCIINLKYFLTYYNKAAVELNKIQLSHELITLWELAWETVK
ncbi:DUF5700 domain-containing putative Zn-dependent protease [Clostridium sp.]|uniref:DUF5700 domain-containing putative Zn-dependent protease n=1 Tax=Clostridium sp. TaxID=1506 RepID=UPI0032167CA8